MLGSGAWCVRAELRAAAGRRRQHGTGSHTHALLRSQLHTPRHCTPVRCAHTTATTQFVGSHFVGSPHTNATAPPPDTVGSLEGGSFFPASLPAAVTAVTATGVEPLSQWERGIRGIRGIPALTNFVPCSYTALTSLQSRSRHQPTPLTTSSPHVPSGSRWHREPNATFHLPRAARGRDRLAALGAAGWGHRRHCCGTFPTARSRREQSFRQ